MSGDRQTQRGGDGSLQIQVAGDYVVGVDEKRAREIADESAGRIHEFTKEAFATVSARVEELNDRMIKTLESQGQLNSFADPAFQRAVTKAQLSAATTERESDYDMLAALLSDRAASPNDRAARAGIERAIEVVDLLDDDALRGLTVLDAMARWSPSSGRISVGLDFFDGFLAQFLDGPLPLGPDWAEHLDVLDAVRVQTISNLIPFHEFFRSRLGGYAASGVIAEDVPEFVGGAAVDVPWAQFLTDHELRPGYKRIAVTTVEKLREVMTLNGFSEPVIEEVALNATGLFGVGGADAETNNAFDNAVRDRPSLRAIAEWWDQVPWAVQPTRVGRILAQANAVRLDVQKAIPEEEE
ncbi:hypothetical protein CVS54_01287 [Microbacterium oxydans]|uniref:Uncharacterized protein n=1 Tax=Microbacterium oxydans TaxID=82380 RepID=A0A3Q9J4J9_9MICO|nr:LPO_1073/Vpar_1526 family protein [Microbacterium oxydans]AZS39969.1 hypothetical protein CVS54_01287 [Microbacterium oxydans]